MVRGKVGGVDGPCEKGGEKESDGVDEGKLAAMVVEGKVPWSAGGSGWGGGEEVVGGGVWWVAGGGGRD
jgi:hypothetical protein